MTKLFKKSKARHTIAGAIEDMKKRLQEVADRHDRFSVPVALPAPAAKVDPRLVDMHKEAAQLIGIDKAKAKLISMLLQSSSHGNGDADDVCAGSSNKMKIISVVGGAGLGKTTLAKAVYDELEPRYDCRAFVSVGREPDLVHVFTDIFFHLDKNQYQDIREVRSLQLLIGELRKLLENKRYFIVIDDVWDLTSWETIRSALDQKHSGSRVITTTRNRDVASEEVYELDPLSCDNSKKLFYMRLFGGGKCPDDQLDGVADKILDKCGGVPLAIITMASLLVGKSREAWLEVCNSSGFYCGKDNKQVDDTVWILSLSYYDMPSDLKNCLLYLSVYPEDYVIGKNSLIWKWVAEGLIEKKSGTSLFQQGEEYFHDLINRNMIHAVDTNEESIYEKGIIYGCRVHDMVLDLIHDLSCGENFVTISNGDKGTLSRNKVPSLSHLHMFVDRMDEAALRVLGGLPQLRSLTLSSVSNLLPLMASVGNITAADGFFQELRYCRLVGWMVHLALNEESTSVSFSIWNGEGDVPFGSKAKYDGCRVAPAVAIMMPNLQELEFYVPLFGLYEYGNGSCGNLGLECLRSLSKVSVVVKCYGAYEDEVEKAEAELRHEAEIHPNTGPHSKSNYTKQQSNYTGPHHIYFRKDGEPSSSTDRNEEDNISAEEEEGDEVSSAADEVAGTDSGDDHNLSAGINSLASLNLQ